MELNWDVPPHNGTAVFFSRDLYDKYSLAPNIKELWAIAHSPIVKSDEVKKEQKSENDGMQRESKPSMEQEEKQATYVENVVPEPKVPFPCLSSLTETEQKIYLRLLTTTSRKLKDNEMQTYQRLQELVNNEVTEFMKFLRNVAWSCAEDYNCIAEGAAHYLEEYFRACNEKVKNYPEVYLINEMTSITGGKFNPELSLNVEKELLVLGQVRMAKTRTPLMPKDIQLTVDYNRVKSEMPPEERACRAHKDISSDLNAEKLCLKYNPHVSLTSLAFYTLLNNHGPDYTDSWELPVCVKMVPEEGNGSKKAIFIDSPLLKKEMTIREKNRIFHEESMNLSLSRNCLKHISDVMLSDHSYNHLVSLTDKTQRKPISFDDMDVDFETDLTDLETFGTSSSSKKPKSQSSPKKKKSDVAGKTPEVSQPSTEPQKMEKTSVKSDEVLEDSKTSESETVLKDLTSADDNSWTDIEDTSMLDSTLETEISVMDRTKLSSEKDDGKLDTSGSAKVSSLMIPPAQLSKPEPGAALFSSSVDSDEERLVIDDALSQGKSGKRYIPLLCNTSSVEESAPEPIPDTPRSPSPEPERPSVHSQATSDTRETTRGGQRLAPKVSKDCDQLGQILKMQSALLQPRPKHPQEPSSPKPYAGNTGHLAATIQSHHQQLLKPSVSSFLEASQGGGAPTAAVPTPADSQQPAGPSKRLLPHDLLLKEENELDYETPQEGNLVYKLYSLGDVLMMVRSNVNAAQPKLGQGFSKNIPVYVLPKLEYQTCYGVEVLTKSEACRLWAEKLLHSSTTLFIAHIDALTSKLFMMEEFTSERTADKFGDFKPANSLNILHHLLKKVIGLQEGRYLLSHKAGEPLVTILKASDGKKVTRATYNLYEAHSTQPLPCASSVVPWVPVDPSQLLPFHIRQGRVPCTFPPRPAGNMQGPKVGVAKGKKNSACARKAIAMEMQNPALPAQPGAQQGVAAKKKKKKKNKGTRAKRAQKGKEKMRQRRLQQKNQNTT
ncbi:little elongation complex subunit 2 [Amia ocellicauda]|uniref:little elongation complex subunit 2 n=1 Tax=Amia ocellicauda TaxID=2972642 RepID=UPI0034649944